MRLPRRHPVLRRGARDRAGRAVHRGARDLRARRGLRDPLEAPTSAAAPTRCRRSRRLVVSFVATVGNYEYGFYWYFYLDGNIQLEVKLTGIVSTMAITPGEQPDVRQRDRARVSRPRTTSISSRPALDVDVDGAANSVFEVEAEPVPAGPENPWGNAFAQKSTRLDSELRAQRDTNAATSRVWKVVNPSRRNASRATRRIQARAHDVDAHTCSRRPSRASAAVPASPVTTSGSRPTGATNDRAAGEYPNQHDGGDGLPLLDRRRPRR